MWKTEEKSRNKQEFFPRWWKLLNIFGFFLLEKFEKWKQRKTASRLKKFVASLVVKLANKFSQKFKCKGSFCGPWHPSKASSKMRFSPKPPKFSTFNLRNFSKKNLITFYTKMILLTSNETWENFLRGFWCLD